MQNFWQRNIFYIVVSLVCIVLYGNTLWNGYAVDDKFVLLENKFVQKGFKGIGLILKTDSFQGFLGETENKLAGGRYRPLALITFAIEYQLWKENPAASHAVNLLLYILVCLLLFRFLSYCLSNSQQNIAFIATLLFALHPIHTEAVANIKGRDEILSLIFILLTLTNITRFVREQKSTYFISGLLYFFFALLSKENGLMLLALVPLTLYFFTNANKNEIIKSTTGILGVIILYLALRIGLTGLKLGDDTEELMNNVYLYASPLEQYATAFYVLAVYIKLLFVPYPLSWDYSFAQYPYFNFANIEVWLSISIYVALLAYAVWKTKEKNVIAYGIWFYLFSIFIVSGLLVNIGGVFLGERFLFQPSIGFALIVSTILVALSERMKQPKLVYALVGLLALPASAWTITRNFHWKNNETLYLTDVNATPNSARANQGAAAVLLTRADKTQEPAQKEADFQAALAYLQKALKIHPRFIDAYVNLAAGYYVRKDYPQAERYLEIADSISPLNQAVYDLKNAVAIGYYNRGLDSVKVKNYQAAIPLMRKGIQLAPKKDYFYYSLGLAYANLNQMEDAKKSFAQAIQLNPNNAQYWYDLGGACYTMGAFPEAVMAWENCIKLDPKNNSAQQGILAAKSKIK